MLKNVTDFTFFNIQDYKCFFDVVNNCIEPVMLSLQSGQTKDLRFNILLQNFVVQMNMDEDLTEVKVQCTNAQDVERLIQFMKDECGAKVR